MNLIDNFLYSIDIFKQDEMFYLNKIDQQVLLPDKYIEIESSHCYFIENKQIQKIKIDHADAICLEFDHRCSIALNSDYLSIMIKNKETNSYENVFPAITGHSNAWPNCPIMIHSNEIYVKFEAQTFNKHWGFHILATGYKLNEITSFKANHQHFQWITTLEQIISRLLGKISRLDLYTIELNPDEKQYKTYLTEENSFLCGGIKHQLFHYIQYQMTYENFIHFIDQYILNINSMENIFLKDLISGNKLTKAMKIYNLILKQVCSNDKSEKMGGKIVKQVIRLFIALCIYHMNIYDVCMNFYHEIEQQQDVNIPSELCYIWKRALELHRTIVKSRAAYILNYEAKIKELSTLHQQSDDEQKQAEYKMTYKGYCHEYIQKLLYLFAIKPNNSLKKYDKAYQIHNTDEYHLDQFETTSNLGVLSLMRTFSDPGPSRSVNVANFNSVLSNFQSAQLYGIKEEKNKSSSTNICNNILNLLKTEAPSITILQDLCLKQNKRATNGINCLSRIQNLLHLNRKSNIIGILSSWGPPFRNYIKYNELHLESADIDITTGTILQNIQIASNVHRDKVKLVFKALFSTLFDYLHNSKHQIIKAMALNSIIIDTNTDFLQLLYKNDILSTLFQLEPSFTATDTIINNIQYIISNLASIAVKYFSCKILYTKDLVFDKKNDKITSLPSTQQGHEVNHHQKTPQKEQEEQTNEQQEVNNDDEEIFKFKKQFSLKNFESPAIKPLSKEKNVKNPSKFHLHSSLPLHFNTAKKVIQLNSLQKSLIKRLVHIVDQHLKAYKIAYKQVETVDQVIILSNQANHSISLKYKSLHSLIYQDLQFLNMLSANKEVIKYLATSKRFINMLFEILDNTSLAIQSIVLTFLPQLLNELSTDILSEIHINSNTTNVNKRSSILHYLLHKIAINIIDHERSLLRVKTCSLRVNNGQIKLSLAYHYISCIRQIFISSTIWSKQLIQILEQNISKLNQNDDQYLYNLALASLYVIGGSSAYLISGCSVITNNNEQGQLLWINRQAGRVKVLFDHNVNKVIECEINKIKAIIPKDIMLAISNKFLMNSKLIQVFDKFTTSLQQEDVKIMKKLKDIQQKQYQKELERKKEEERKLKRLERQRKRSSLEAQQPTEWPCPICTYVQKWSANCELCNTQNPAFFKETNIINDHDVNDDDDDSTIDDLNNSHQESSLDHMIDDATYDDLLYHQLRFSAIKSLCCLLNNTKSASYLISSQKLLHSLILMAAKPTILNSFQSINQLENMQLRVTELILDSSLSIVDDRLKYIEHAKSNELKASIFKDLPLYLPNALDISSSKYISFNDELLNTITFIHPALKESKSLFKVGLGMNIGVVRANYMIPSSLKAYYFEIKIVNMGKKALYKKDNESSTYIPFDLAVGLHRSGTALTGIPGLNSYAYSASGEIHYTIEGHAIRDIFTGYQAKDVLFKQGDIIGCGWRVIYQTRKIFFTLNGKLLGEPLSDDKSLGGQFFPACWLQHDQSQISFNFGQTPFKYDFNSSLSSDYLNELKLVSKKHGNFKITEQEIRRKTMAEDLVTLMGGSFPSELCEMALERNNDNIQYAADWLITKGHQALSKMANDVMARTAREAKEAKNGSIQDNDNNDDSDLEQDLMSWLIGNEAIAATANVNRSNSSFIYNNSDELDELQLSSYMRNRTRYQYRRNNQSIRLQQQRALEFLDDEIDNDIPIDVIEQNTTRSNQDMLSSSSHHHNHHNSNARSNRKDQRQLIVDNVKLEDIQVGQLLRISSFIKNINNSLTNKYDANKKIEQFANLTGIVINTNVNEQKVTLMFFNANTGMKISEIFPVQGLCKPQRLWQDPLLSLAINNQTKWNKLAGYYIYFERACSIRLVRNAMLHLINNWPGKYELRLSNLAGAINTTTLLKLISVEFLSTQLNRHKIKKQYSSTSALEQFKKRLIKLIHHEQHQFIQHNDVQNLPKLHTVDFITQHKFNNHNLNLDHIDLSLITNDMIPLSQLLLENCILHMVQGVFHPPSSYTYQSIHPFPSNTQKRGKIYLAGSTKLLVTFDQRSNLGNNMMNALTFYRDENYQDIIIRYTGNYQNYSAVVIEADFFYYKFTGSTNNNNWGYKFKVQPFEQRKTDFQAIKGLNYELGEWLLHLIITSYQTKIQIFYLPDLFNIAIWTLIHSPFSMKSRYVDMMLQILTFMLKILHDDHHQIVHMNWQEINFHSLQQLNQQMNDILSQIDQQDLQTANLQSLIELLSLVEIAQVQFTKYFHTNTTQMIENNQIESSKFSF